MEAYGRGVRAYALTGQQHPFCFQAARIAGQAPVGADDPMAGNDNGNWIVTHRPAHRLRGHARQAALCRQAPGDLPVGRRFSVGNLLQKLPHRALEGGASHMDRRHEVRLPPREVNIQPPHRLQQNRRFLRLVLPVQLEREVFSALKPQAGEANRSEERRVGKECRL